MMKFLGVTTLMVSRPILTSWSNFLAPLVSLDAPVVMEKSI